MKCTIIESKTTRFFRSEEYNFNFNKETGFFARWGKTKDEDPEFCKVGPEIADIEISTVCTGIGTPCNFCYKGNTPKGENMSLKTFKTLMNIFPKTLTQIAFGIGDINANKDLWKIMEYTRKNNVIPNVTINGYNLTDKYAKKLSKLCGAVAVSRYNPKDVCYNAVKKLTDLGMKQVNIHIMISEETYQDCLQVLEDYKTDERLKNLNAIVFLSLKQKGRGHKFTPVSQEKFSKIVEIATKDKISIGFDSCSAKKAMEAYSTHENFNQIKTFIEPCESGLFSSYFNVRAEFFPCSFMEGEGEWVEGIKINNKMKFSDLWNGERVNKWRKNLIENKRHCPCFKI